MLADMDLSSCQGMAVSAEVMRHVVKVESAFNPYAIGVVGGRLVRQPENLQEALTTVRSLEEKGYNFSLGLAQVNRYNLSSYGLNSYEAAFSTCPNLQAGARILAECFSRSGGDWGKSFSCYYSGNFVTGYRHGYVQKVLTSMRESGSPLLEHAAVKEIPVIGRVSRHVLPVDRDSMRSPQRTDYLLQGVSPVTTASTAAVSSQVSTPAIGPGTNLPSADPLIDNAFVF